LEERWQKLSARKQKRWVILFFSGYLLITGCVVFKVWYDAKNDAIKAKSDTGRIINPIQQQKKPGSLLKDSLSTTQKNKDYERK
jgi:hypothetical protein